MTLSAETFGRVAEVLVSEGDQVLQLIAGIPEYEPGVAGHTTAATALTEIFVRPGISIL